MSTPQDALSATQGHLPAPRVPDATSQIHDAIWQLKKDPFTARKLQDFIRSQTGENVSLDAIRGAADEYREKNFLMSIVTQTAPRGVAWVLIVEREQDFFRDFIAKKTLQPARPVKASEQTLKL